MCGPIVRFSIAANACHAGVIPMGTANATEAKMNGPAHIVER